MTLNEILDILAAHRAERQAFGVRSLAVFGSFARGEEQEASDVDVIVDFEAPATFDRYLDLRFLLEDILGRKVDLVTRGALEARVRPAIEREAVRVP